MSAAESDLAGIEDAAPLFAALGDGTRLELLRRLGEDGPASITRLASHREVTRQAITKHLSVLSAVGLVRSSRQGRERVWQIEPARLSDAQSYLARISRQWDDALLRLKSFVEGDG